jgi:hypothetical protein
VRTDRLYLAPTAALHDDRRPRGGFQSHTAPDDPTVSLVVVNSWEDPRAQDAWESLPEVIAFYPEDHGAPVGPMFGRAFASWGVQLGDTRRAAFGRLRRVWPGFVI